MDAALAEIALLAAVLTLPKGTIHVISDIHGEDQKLRHVINNASGTLRPLVERLFVNQLSHRIVGTQIDACRNNNLRQRQNP